MDFKEVPLVIGYTGLSGDTLSAVSAVRSLIDKDPSAMKLINRIGELTLSVKKALLSEDLNELGSLMTENHSLLKQLGVSSPELDRLVDAALSAGAFGAKLTGGGRGGCMLALSDSEDVCTAISDAGGQVLKASISAEGVRLED